MKLKQSPRDFRVFEELEFERDKKGPYTVHKLVKEKLGTLEALDRVARIARVPRASIAYAGLKDRQAITHQFISLENERVSIQERDLKVRFVGRSAEKINSKQSSGNRFQIVVRDLAATDLARLRRNRRSVETAGLPNYFDDQRFGCLVHGQGFVARSLAERRPDAALRQLLATPSGEERGGDAKLRRLLAEHWGDWEACRRIARGPMYAAVFGHLQRRPDDFLGALERVPARLKLIHLFAFQSWLFNLGVRDYLRGMVRDDQRVGLRSVCGELVCWRYLSDEARAELLDKQLPLIDAGTRYEDARFERAMRGVLDGIGLRQEQLRFPISGFRLREEPRPLVLVPRGLAVLGPWSDERNDGRLKVELRFKLPRGAYATLVVRRLFAEPVRSRRREDRRRPPRKKEPRAASQGPPRARRREPPPPAVEPAQRPARRKGSVLRRLLRQDPET